MIRWMIAGLLVTALPATAQDEAGLRAADARQHQAARTRDADALAAMMHPRFAVNAPEGEIWSRERTVALWRNRGIGHDRFDRVVENVILDGDVGVVAGRRSFSRRSTVLPASAAPMAASPSVAASPMSGCGVTGAGGSSRATPTSCPGR